MRAPAEVRFWRKVAQGEAGCWRWTARLNSDGYGDLRVGPRLIRAHRFAYELLVGPIPEGLTLDHLCRNRACVNPDHLEPVTPQENTRRGRVGTFNRSKTRCPQGHAYSPENTYVYPQGSRACRTCMRESDRRRRRSASRQVGAAS